MVERTISIHENLLALPTLGAPVLVGSPADFGKPIATDTAKWGKVVQFAGIKPD